MSWERVQQWRDRLAQRDLSTIFAAPGPRQAARVCWVHALDALDDHALRHAAQIPGTPYRTAVIVCARTVFTAPIEWSAVLLGRGTRVVLKHPTGAPGATAVLVEAAQAVGLPLSATDDRDSVQKADLVVAMGSDPTIAALEEQLPARVDRLLFGHRFSAAWVTGRDPTWPDAVAMDALAHDGRGCLTPQVVLTPMPVAAACDALAAGLERQALATFTAGEIGAAEGARIRARTALATVTGLARTGSSWAVHALPPTQWHPEALPRTVAVLQAADLDAARQLLSPWARWLSTVGTDDEEATPWPGARTCALGEMQRPPLDRLHDGVDWLRRTLRAR